MTPIALTRRALLAGAALASAPFRPARAAAPAALQLVATFTSPRQVTGVAVTPTGRIFVNFPRWEEDVAISVAEVGPGGTLTPYPTAAWNAYRNAAPTASSPQSSFVCVQSVTTDPLGYVWALDAAAPDLTFIVPGGPKAVRINPATNQVVRVYLFDQTVAPQGTYLNDIRFTTDGRTAIITNSGQPGSLIVLDVVSGAARRVLDNHPSTQFQQNLVTIVDGQPLLMPDGQPPHFSADGLVVDNQYAYWQATTGTELYRIPLLVLLNPTIPPALLAGYVQPVTQTFIADGYLLTRSGNFYLTSDADNAVKQLLPGNQVTTVVQDPRLLWPDSMAEGPDGSIYVTASHIPEMRMWQGPGVTQTQLFRFQP